MKRHFELSSFQKILIAVVTAAFICLSAFLAVREKRENERRIEENRIRFEQRKEKQRLEQEEQEQAIMRRTPQIVSGGNVGSLDFIEVSDVLNGSVDGIILISAEEFEQKAVVETTDNKCLSIALHECNLAVRPDDIMILQFTGRSESLCTLGVYCAGTLNKVALSETPRTFYIPIAEAEKIDDVVFEQLNGDDGAVLENVYLTKYDSRTAGELAIGAFLTDESVPAVNLNPYLIYKGNAKKVLADGDYLYVLIAGGIDVLKCQNGKYTSVAKVTGLGSSTRDMAFSKDKRTIIVTARQCGAWLVDVSNPEAAHKITSFDTLEATTGLCVDGDYVFFGDRYFGVTIADISDPANPKFVSNVTQGKEYQSCYAAEGYLYVGIYEQKQVDIYDVRNPYNPVLVGNIGLDGSGQGVASRGHLLYVPTALNSGYNQYSKEWNYGKGSGNGFEIYDVSDPSAPVLKSVSKLDGIETINYQVVWDIQLSGNYAFLSMMFKGLYVYDITDAENPVLVQHYVAPKEDTAAPSNQTASNENAAVWHTFVQNGKAFVAINGVGIAMIDCEYAHADPEKAPFTYQPEKAAFEIKARAFDVQRYAVDASVWSSELTEDAVYIACGKAGFQKLTRNLELLESVETEYSVKDIAVCGNLLVTAESEGGLGIYQIGDSIREKGRILGRSGDYYTALELSDDGKTAIVQNVSGGAVVFDISNPEKPAALERITTNGSMYFRNIVKETVSGYLGCYGKTTIVWYKDGNMLETPNPFYGERNGIVSMGRYCLAITRKGYKYFDLQQNNISDPIGFSNVDVSGKGGTDGMTLAVANGALKKIMIVDIADLDNPVLLEELQVDGNPDIPNVDGEEVYVPCRYGGLLKITPKK